MGANYLATLCPGSSSGFHPSKDYFVEGVKYTCPLCMEPLWKPYQTVCGHRLCEGCLQKYFQEKGDPATCPYGEADCGVISLKADCYSVHFDAGLQKEIGECHVYCGYKHKGCKAVIPLKSKQKHEEDCEYGGLACVYNIGNAESLPHLDMPGHTQTGFYGGESPSSLRRPSMPSTDEMHNIPDQMADGATSNDEMGDTQVSIHQFRQLQQEKEERERVLQAEIERLKRKLDISAQELRVTQQRLQKYEEESIRIRCQEIQDTSDIKSYDGVLIWEICDYRKKKEWEQSERIPFFLSPSFYTSRPGYLVCLQAFLNGDGVGTGTHLSLFFRILRGKYDDLLTFPFTFTVSIMVLDKVLEARHIVDTLNPTQFSSGFQGLYRDVSAIGFPLFCQHSLLEAPDSVYLRGGSLFVKCEIN